MISFNFYLICYYGLLRAIKLVCGSQSKIYEKCLATNLLTQNSETAKVKQIYKIYIQVVIITFEIAKKSISVSSCFHSICEDNIELCSNFSRTDNCGCRPITYTLLFNNKRISTGNPFLYFT